ncbi:hypothetical protein U9M48_023198 [Paspalum notatum var. saurae]|uniref:Uncharacterized protein n=1 Tax=Paspalum notatum var. saurae TaxID=547442 RepID=A0AAQ3TNY2_PASNO
MELCCREGPDGGTVPRGKNPRKWLALPRSRGFPLNGCMPRVASQQLGTMMNRRKKMTSTNGRRRVRLRLMATPSSCKQPAAMSSSTGGGQVVEILLIAWRRG